ncbi:MAG: hypothetical protein FWE37_05290 [Spirochaetaceae bacterium]|nr:hypothetical protein [Spirochaetaceae bacterium]
MKSRLELALERSNDIQLDGAVLKEERYETEGRKLAAKALAKGDFNLKEALAGPEQALLLKGVLKTLMANLILPNKQEDLAAFIALKAAFINLNTQTEPLLTQLESFLADYLANRHQLTVQIEAHFRPLIEQKEQEIERKTGMKVKLSADKIPEAQKVLNEQLATFEQNYLAELKRAKEVLANIINP